MCKLQEAKIYFCNRILFKSLSMQFREINVQIHKIIEPNNLLKIKKNIIEFNPILENEVIQSYCSKILERFRFVIECRPPILQSSTLNLIYWTQVFSIRGRSQTTFTRFGFFDHLPPSVYIFCGIKVYKKSIFLTTYPPPFVNVVCERPLTAQ